MLATYSPLVHAMDKKGGWSFWLSPTSVSVDYICAIVVVTVLHDIVKQHIVLPVKHLIFDSFNTETQISQHIGKDTCAQTFD